MRWPRVRCPGAMPDGVCGARALARPLPARALDDSRERVPGRLTAKRVWEVRARIGSQSRRFGAARLHGPGRAEQATRRPRRPAQAVGVGPGAGLRAAGLSAWAGPGAWAMPAGRFKVRARATGRTRDSEGRRRGGPSRESRRASEGRGPLGPPGHPRIRGWRRPGRRRRVPKGQAQVPPRRMGRARAPNQSGCRVTAAADRGVVSSPQHGSARPGASSRCCARPGGDREAECCSSRPVWRELDRLLG